MRQLDLTGFYSEPSVLSGTLVVLGSIVLLVIANFNYIQHSSLITSAIFGSNAPSVIIEQSQTSIGAFSNVILSNAILNKILFFGFWMMVGLIVYVVLGSLGKSVSDTEQDIESLHYVHARTDIIKKNILLKTATRISVLIALFIYVWFFIRLLFPFSVIAVRVWLGGEHLGWLYALLGFVVLIAALHLLVILLRLFALKARLLD